MSYGKRGKEGEKKVDKALKKYDIRADFAYNRYPDAHAGSLASAPADFEAQLKGVNYKLEVKETEQLHRLPKTNFAGDQRSRMNKWRAAGCQSWVIIWLKSTDKWILASITEFPTLPEGVGSWDLREIGTKYDDIDTLLYDLFCVPPNPVK